VFLVLGGVILLIVVLCVALAFRRQQKYPEKNFKHNLIEICLTPARFLRLGPYAEPLSLDYSIKAAIKKSKLSDIGDSEFIENYRVVMESKNYKAQRFTNIGYISAQIELYITWVRRLRFIQYLKEVPEVVKVPVRSPVFVMGLPRTGTTFLHRLLSLDPQCRAPLLWELLNPIPTVHPSATDEEKEKDKQKRIKRIRELIEMRRDMGDRALVHIHEIGYDLPEECLMSLTDEIPINLQFLYSCYMSSGEFLKMSTAGAYRYYRKVLQLLSLNEGDTVSPKRWVLKCPIHLFYPKEIAQAFPDAKLIWTHRHPVSAVPSLCSLLKAVHQIYFDKDGRNDAALGGEIAKVTGDLLEKAPKDIAESGLSCFNVTYNTLIADPIGTVKNVYKEYGWTFTEEYEKILQDYLDANRKDREKKTKGEVLHTYSPSEFGLTEEVLSKDQFDAYCKEFNIPISRN